jgi:hypothetical protein
MSATKSDGTYTQAIENAQLSAARTQRMAKDQQGENAKLKARIDDVERIMAQLTVRLDALESLGEMFLDEPIPYELPQGA